MKAPHPGGAGVRGLSPVHLLGRGNVPSRPGEERAVASCISMGRAGGTLRTRRECSRGWPGWHPLPRLIPVPGSCRASCRLAYACPPRVSGKPARHGACAGSRTRSAVSRGATSALDGPSRGSPRKGLTENSSRRMKAFRTFLGGIGERGSNRCQTTSPVSVLERRSA
jgi:hypothetical protein